MAGKLENVKDEGGFVGWGGGRAEIGRDECNNPAQAMTSWQQEEHE